MSQIRQNKITVPINSDAYNLTGDLATMADSANVFVNVNSQAERDGISNKYAGLTVRRMDVATHPLEEWDGAAWNRGPVVVTGSLVSDGFWNITGTLIKTTLSPTVSVVQMVANLVRTGTAMTVNTTDTALLVGMIPTGFRPSPNSAYFYGPVNDSIAGARYADPQFVINGGGSLVARSVSGGAITIATNYAMFFNTTWLQM